MTRTADAHRGTAHAAARAERYCPEWPFPPYAYTPGRTPHPVRDPAGHGVRLPESAALAVEPAAWRASPAFRYGVDLFNAGYPWEAHEAWEDLWRACPAESDGAHLLGALIKTAAAGVKAATGNPRGIARTTAKADARLARTELDPCFGLSPAHLRAALARLDPDAAAAAGVLPVWLAPGVRRGATAGLSSGRPPRG